MFFLLKGCLKGNFSVENHTVSNYGISLAIEKGCYETIYVDEI